MSEPIRKSSLRLKAFDYRSLGAYFVTICTHERQNMFGEIREGVMGLNEAGSMAAQELQKSIDIRREIELDVWILMPNHLHMVIFVVGVDGVDPSPSIDPGTGACHAPLHRSGRSIPSFVAGFKSATTKLARLHHDAPPNQSVWQRNYYDHIIHNEKSLNNIRGYILGNPGTWERDIYH